MEASRKYKTYADAAASPRPTRAAAATPSYVPNSGSLQKEMKAPCIILGKKDADLEGFYPGAAGKDKGKKKGLKSGKNEKIVAEMIEKEFKAKEERKKEEKKKQGKKHHRSSSASSTLSGYIREYETWLETQFDEEARPPPSPSASESANREFRFPDVFEFPRQNKRGDGRKPEVMQFKASQKLLSPKQAPTPTTTGAEAASTTPTTTATTSSTLQSSSSTAATSLPPHPPPPSSYSTPTTETATPSPPTVSPAVTNSIPAAASSSDPLPSSHQPTNDKILPEAEQQCGDDMNLKKFIKEAETLILGFNRQDNAASSSSTTTTPSTTDQKMEKINDYLLNILKAAEKNLMIEITTRKSKPSREEIIKYFLNYINDSRQQLLDQLNQEGNSSAPTTTASSATAVASSPTAATTTTNPLTIGTSSSPRSPIPPHASLASTSSAPPAYSNENQKPTDADEDADSLAQIAENGTGKKRVEFNKYIGKMYIPPLPGRIEGVTRLPEDTVPNKDQSFSFLEVTEGYLEDPEAPFSTSSTSTPASSTSTSSTSASSTSSTSSSAMDQTMDDDSLNQLPSSHQPTNGEMLPEAEQQCGDDMNLKKFIKEAETLILGFNRQDNAASSSTTTTDQKMEKINDYLLNILKAAEKNLMIEITTRRSKFTREEIIKYFLNYINESRQKLLDQLNQEGNSSAPTTTTASSATAVASSPTAATTNPLTIGTSSSPRSPIPPHASTSSAPPASSNENQKPTDADEDADSLAQIAENGTGKKKVEFNKYIGKMYIPSLPGRIEGVVRLPEDTVPNKDQSFSFLEVTEGYLEDPEAPFSTSSTSTPASSTSTSSTSASSTSSSAMDQTMDDDESLNPLPSSRQPTNDKILPEAEQQCEDDMNLKKFIKEAENLILGFNRQDNAASSSTTTTDQKKENINEYLLNILKAAEKNLMIQITTRRSKFSREEIIKYFLNYINESRQKLLEQLNQEGNSSAPTTTTASTTASSATAAASSPTAATTIFTSSSPSAIEDQPAATTSSIPAATYLPQSASLTPSYSTTQTEAILSSAAAATKTQTTTSTTTPSTIGTSGTTTASSSRSAVPPPASLAATSSAPPASSNDRSTTDPIYVQPASKDGRDLKRSLNKRIIPESTSSDFSFPSPCRRKIDDNDDTASGITDDNEDKYDDINSPKDGNSNIDDGEDAYETAKEDDEDGYDTAHDDGGSIDNDDANDLQINQSLLELSLYEQHSDASIGHERLISPQRMTSESQKQMETSQTSNLQDATALQPDRYFGEYGINRQGNKNIIYVEIDGTNEYLKFYLKNRKYTCSTCPEPKKKTKRIYYNVLESSEQTVEFVESPYERHLPGCLPVNREQKLAEQFENTFATQVKSKIFGDREEAVKSYADEAAAKGVVRPFTESQWYRKKINLWKNVEAVSDSPAHSPVASRDAEHVHQQGEQRTLYFEPQEGMMCGRHTLNNLLQLHMFGDDDVKIAGEEARQREAEVFQLPVDFVANQDVSDSGNLSLQTMNILLQPLNLALHHLTDLELGTLITNQENAHALVIHRQNHWFSLLRIQQTWILFDSLNQGPVPVTDIESYLIQLLEAESIIFGVEGDLPHSGRN